MFTRPLGDTGLIVSTLGYGAGDVGTTAESRQRVIHLIHTLLDEGVNVFDTAACYEGSEPLLGEALRGKRDQAVIISKCGHHDILPDGSMRSRAISIADIDLALQRLDVEHLDVMLLHSYDRDLLEAGDALQVLIRAKEAGKIRHAGYSGDNETAEYAAALDAVTVIETSVNVCDQANLELVVPIAQASGVGVVAKRPIANAAWRHLGQPAGTWPAHHAAYVHRLERMWPSLQALGLDEPFEEAWPGIALRFTLSQPGVHTAIVGTTQPANALANVRAARQGPLPEAMRDAIVQAFVDARSRDRQAWPGQN